MADSHPGHRADVAQAVEPEDGSAALPGTFLLKKDGRFPPASFSDTRREVLCGFHRS